MIYPVYIRQYIDDPSIKILFVKDTEESTSRLIPVRYSKTSSFTEYKNHLYNKYGKEVILDDNIRNVMRCLSEIPIYGRGDAVFLVTLNSDPNTESLACAITDSNGNTRIVIHPECKNNAIVTSLSVFFGENTCLESWFGKMHLESIYLIADSNNSTFTIFDSSCNGLISAEIYHTQDSTIPLYKGVYIFDRNPYIDEKQRFTISLRLHHKNYELHTDEPFLEAKLLALKPQEIPHYIPFYLTT